MGQRIQVRDRSVDLPLMNKDQTLVAVMATQPVTPLQSDHGIGQDCLRRAVGLLQIVDWPAATDGLRVESGRVRAADADSQRSGASAHSLSAADIGNRGQEGAAHRQR